MKLIRGFLNKINIYTYNGTCVATGKREAERLGCRRKALMKRRVCNLPAFA